MPVSLEPTLLYGEVPHGRELVAARGVQEVHLQPEAGGVEAEVPAVLLLQGGVVLVLGRRGLTEDSVLIVQKYISFYTTMV